MPLTLRTRAIRLPYTNPFVIARKADSDATTTVIVELRDDRYPGFVGMGEGCPEPYYGETVSTIAATLPMLLDVVGEPNLTADGLARAGELMDEAIRWNGAAKCALDIALHDLAGKVQGVPVHQLLGLSAVIPPTDMTLGMAEPDVVAQRAVGVRDFPALKIKVGGPADLAVLEAVRAVYDGPIRIDANTAWTLETALSLLPDLERLGVELIEQPFPARRYDLLARLQERSSLPIVADESAQTIEDLDALVGVVAGINVKLIKCGGVGFARRMLERARELGFKTFIGCMGETSIAIGAGAAVASLADWVDLDANLELAEDPISGLELGSDHRWLLGPAAGLGLRWRDGWGIGAPADGS